MSASRPEFPWARSHEKSRALRRVARVRSVYRGSPSLPRFSVVQPVFDSWPAHFFLRNSVAGRLAARGQVFPSNTRCPHSVWLSMPPLTFGLVVSLSRVKRNFSGQRERLEPIQQFDAQLVGPV